LLTRRLACFLLLLTAAAAPWLCGARVSVPTVGGWLGGVLALSFFLMLMASLRERRWPSISPWALGPVGFLLGCLGWWATQPAPAFATHFAAEHWRFIRAQLPRNLLEWPREELLVFLAGALLGFLAVVDLGRSARFRGLLAATLGLSGFVVAIWALGLRWLGWPAPTWIEVASGTERFNIAFFHHNAPGAALNLAWPLLVFHPAWPPASRAGLIVRLALASVVLLTVAAALPLWHSESAPAIAAGLLLAGLAWPLATRLILPSRALFFALICAGFFGLFAWQLAGVQRLRVTHPDGWVSAAHTAREAPVRDAAVQAAAEKRGDHLVSSSAPARPAAWITGLRMARDYPLIGLGPGAWLHGAVLYSNDPTVATFYQLRQFAHHDLLQAAAEWGGLGAVAWLALWTGAFWRAMHAGPDSLGPLLALIGLALLSLVHFPLQNPAIFLWSLLLLGLAWSCSETATET